jgi:hypothetical protein
MMLGCQRRPADQASGGSGAVDELRHGDRFPREDEPRQIHRVFDAQAAAGARADATLHACHFDTGGTPTSLNSLGEEKLELMLLADASLPMVVYLDVAKDETYASREQAVRVYLKDRGLTDAQVTLVQGQNKHNTSPAAARLQAAAALEGNPQAGSTPHGGATTGGTTTK